jgi:His-Xaa-Ser system radical SAM maturase HxsC
MLALSGVATEVRGFSRPEERRPLRVCAPGTAALHEADIALVHNDADIQLAIASKFEAVLAISGGDVRLDAAATPRSVHLPLQFGYLAPGDVLGFHPASKRFRTLYRRSSRHNSMLVTDQCNHYCLMCSQPPKNVDDSWILKEIRQALPLVDKNTSSLGFTGGEPLLNWQGFVEVLRDCRIQLPETCIHVLSNGRAFASSTVSQAWAAVEHPNLMVGIPVYSAVDTVHDYVVQAKGAFDETILGILKLKDQGQRVEVRVVLHAITAPRIVETCEWLARNLPFVDHVALMGLENTGFAIANDTLLWIDPMDYRVGLAKGVEALTTSNVNVSVYNLQLCVLDPTIWPFAAQSISDWKNDYVSACDSCIERERCSGFFTTGRPRYSRGIQAIG